MDKKEDATTTDPTKPKEKVKSKYVARTPMEIQRIKVERLMENPDKPVVIPISNKQKNLLAAVPTFVRNVMGSSAGAGSGEFHVYRHLRRKEYARQKHIQHKSRQEELDDEYNQRIENNQNAAESKTAKKRAKRLKQKLRAKNKPKSSVAATADEPDESDDASSDADENNADNNDDDDEAPAVKVPKINDENDDAITGNADEQLIGPCEKPSTTTEKAPEENKSDQVSEMAEKHTTEE